MKATKRTPVQPCKQCIEGRQAREDGLCFDCLGRVKARKQAVEDSKYKIDLGLVKRAAGLK